MISALTIWRWQFHIYIGKLWIDDKATWVWVYNLGGGRQSKTSKDECESFYNNITMNHLT
jgi:hypothetical protein